MGVCGGSKTRTMAETDEHNEKSSNVRRDAFLVLLAKPRDQDQEGISLVRMRRGGRTGPAMRKDISLLRPVMVMPQVLRQFDFELSCPDLEWSLHDHWLACQAIFACIPHAYPVRVR